MKITNVSILPSPDASAAGRPHIENGGFSAKIIEDSITIFDERLTTMEVTCPRFILAELNTHRDFSRNSASSRAIPTEKMIERVIENPFIPEAFGLNKRGMQAGEDVDEVSASLCRDHWLHARDSAVAATGMMNHLKVHKQWCNRLLEPFMWHTVIISSTRWKNFFSQRCDPAAQPEMQKIAYMMRNVLESSIPVNRNNGQIHAPYIQMDEWNQYLDYEIAQISIARCARVSYLQQDGTRDISKDLELFNRLLAGKHFSPFEHVAYAMLVDDKDRRSGNFDGFKQLRKSFKQEYIK